MQSIKEKEVILQMDKMTLILCSSLSIHIAETISWLTDWGGFPAYYKQCGIGSFGWSCCPMLNHKDDRSPAKRTYLKLLWILMIAIDGILWMFASDRACSDWEFHPLFPLDFDDIDMFSDDIFIGFCLLCWRCLLDWIWRWNEMEKGGECAEVFWSGFVRSTDGFCEQKDGNGIDLWFKAPASWCDGPFDVDAN